MMRAGSEDRGKHRADEQRNRYPYKKLASSGLIPVRAGDIKAGDIIRVEQNEMIPADIIFLGSALKKGHCFIDKANLNGETALEVMFSLPSTRSFTAVPDDLNKLRARVAWEAPNGK